MRVEHRPEPHDHWLLLLVIAIVGVWLLLGATHGTVSIANQSGVDPCPASQLCPRTSP